MDSISGAPLARKSRDVMATITLTLADQIGGAMVGHESFAMTFLDGPASRTPCPPCHMWTSGNRGGRLICR